MGRWGGIITGAGSILETFRLRPGQSVAIFGVGTMGLAAVMAAHLAGASKIVALDIDYRLLDLARQLGAAEGILCDNQATAALRETLPHGFDFTLNTTTHPDVFTMACECLAKEGTAGIVTRPSGGWTPNIPGLLANGRTIRVILGGSANPHLVHLVNHRVLATGSIPARVAEYRFPFERIEEAWRAFVQGEVVKPLLRMV